MGEHSRPNPNDFIHFLGIANVCRACKSFLSKCYPEKQPFFLKKAPHKHKHKPKPIEDAKISKSKTKKHNAGREADDRNKRHDKGRFRQGSGYDDMAEEGSGSSRLSRNMSYHGRRAQAQAGGALPRSLSHKESTRGAAGGGLTHTFSRSTSKGIAAPIIFSNSSGLMKPAAMELQLDCTLEELCFGCIKKVAVTRDAVKAKGQIVQEDEIMTIKVEPGWRRGTKVKFEGKGNQMPGTEAADVVFVISEKEHSLFKREEDDLQMGVEIKLVDALAGCTLLLPLLGGETISLGIEDVVHPGYVKTIHGQGMPRQHEPGTRGDLIVNISVKFPETLTQEQRSNAATILQQTC